ncbi:transcriptional regulator, partial [Nocardia donostiensis]
FNDTTVADILDHARDATGSQWTVPVQTLSRFTLNVIDGIVLRWLVDNDSESVRVQLDLLADMLAGHTE